MMFRSLGSRAAACAAVLVMLGLGVAAHAMAPTSPIGTWTTENGHGVIAIAPCGDALCGRIVGIDRAPGDPMPTDVHGQSQCGLTIITGERPDDPGTWVGHITDPRDGSVYGARLWVQNGNLHLRGYLGIPLLGSTQVWRPFTGRLTPDCGLA